MPTLPARAARRGVPLLRRPRRRRPPHAHPRPHRGARPRRRRRQRRARVVGHPQGRRRPGRPARPSRPTATTFDVRAARRRQRRRACGPTTCARSTRARTPTRSARPRASTSPCRGRRCATTSPSSSRSPRTSARCSSCRGATSPTSAPPTPTTTARSTIRSARREDIDYLLGAINHAIVDELTDATTSLGTWAGLRPLVHDARQRAHRRPVPPPPGHAVGQRRHHRHRRQAHDLPRDGRRHRRRSSLEQVLGAKVLERRDQAQPHPPPAAARRRGLRRARRLGGDRPGASAPSARPPGQPLRRRGPHARRHDRGATRRWPSRSCRACPTCGPRPSTRRATRWPARVDDVLSRRTRARLLARDASAAAAADVAALHRRRARLGRGRAGRPGRRPTAPPSTHERTAAGLPETALDAAARRLTQLPAAADD